MSTIFTENKLSIFRDLVEDSNQIIISCHQSPDGDAIGSCLALYHWLKNKYSNKKINLIVPDEFADFLKWMAGASEIIVFESKQEESSEQIKNADLVFMMDYNAPKRVGNLMEKPLLATTAKKIMIDHHREPSDFPDLSFSDISSCSTAQLVYELIESLNDLESITKEMAECIYLGILTDSGSFKYSSVNHKTHLIAAFLLQKGINHTLIHEYISNNNPPEKLYLLGYVLNRKLKILKEHKTSYISLSQEEFARFNAQKGYTEGIINHALSVKGVEMAAFFREDKGKIKISFRSQGDIPINELAKKHFNGGGHINAAGGSSLDSLEETINKFKSVLPTFVSEYVK